MFTKMETLIQSFCKYLMKFITYIKSICKYSYINNNYYFYMLLFVYSHVQISNEGAIDFYKKFGFEIVETKEHYYKRIEPADAHVLQKTLRPKTNQTNNQQSNQ